MSKIAKPNTLLTLTEVETKLDRVSSEWGQVFKEWGKQSSAYVDGGRRPSEKLFRHGCQLAKQLQQLRQQHAEMLLAKST